MSLVTNGENLSFRKIFENLFKKRFDEIIELTDETNFDDLTYYFKNGKRKRFDDFKNGIIFEK